jgi:hypothetical protein
MVKWMGMRFSAPVAVPPYFAGCHADIYFPPAVPRSGELEAAAGDGPLIRRQPRPTAYQ